MTSTSDIVLFVFGSTPEYHSVPCTLLSSPSHEDFQTLASFQVDMIARSQYQLLPASTSWDIAKIEAVQVKDLPSSAVSSLKNVEPGPTTSRIFKVSRQEDIEKRQMLRKTILREARLTLQQAASKAAAAQEETKAIARAAEARAAEAMVQATKARREGRDASAKAEQAEAKAEQAEAKAEQAEAKAEQAEAKAEQAKTDAAEARATVEALQRKLALLHKGRVATINSKLCRLKESLKGFEQVLRYEVLVRIMRTIDLASKDVLTPEENDILKKAKFDWVVHLVNVEEYNVVQEVEDLAQKLRENLSAELQDLLAFCADAAYHYGKVRHPLQHPIPTLHYAQEALAAIALDLQESNMELDVDFARRFIAEQSQLFASDECPDPRQQMEDEIADLEIDKAISESLI